jgi:hypothetical protein
MIKAGKFMKRLVFVIVFSGLFINVFSQNSKIPILNIKAYLNNTEIEGPVYKDIYGINNLSSLVKLTSIFKLLDVEVKINDKIIEIRGEKTGNIKINYINQNNISIYGSYIDEEVSQNQTKNSIILINNEYFIRISMVRYLIKGALQEDKNSVILYTRDYERPDIPLTLNDCYIALNKTLDAQVKNDIKNSSVNDLYKYHFGLGMWIRNNWIRQTNNRITKLFLDNDIRNPDFMAQIIIKGYHYYLNGIEKTIMELDNE